MRFLRRSVVFAAAILFASAGAAMAHSFAEDPTNMLAPASQNLTGSWPVTVSRSQRSNGTYCLTLTENSRNAGSASLVIGSQKYPYGTFQIFNHTLVATIEVEGYGQNAGLVFIGSAGRGTIGAGVFDDVYGGEAFDEGALAFGMKGGC
ncbi:MAG: hypothetical protein JOZ77_02990 [Candidatus Eremiobacteraeota bacterium]|nr:hypothetical protein [Candidatus Eremiobacteraeota bacterium]